MNDKTLTATMPLYERLGGERAVVAAVDELYVRALADGVLAPSFAGVDLAWLKRRQVAFFAEALGGPARYEGASMRDAHARLAISRAQFDRVAEHLVAALLHVGVSEALAAEVLSVVAPLADEIVTATEGSSGPKSAVRRVLETSGRFKGDASGAARRPTASDPLEGADGLRAALDCLQTNVFVADLDLRLVYMNPRALEKLRDIEDEVRRAFKVGVDEIQGASIHRFHRDPRRVERILRTPGGLPHEAEFTFGPITLRSRINGIFKPDLIGYVVTWEDVSEESRRLADLTRTTNMVDNAPTNIMFADRDLKLRFMNPAMTKTLKLVEAHLPVKVDALLGQSIDIFHKRPEVQRRLLSDHKNLPHLVQIQIGEEHFTLLVSAIFDQHEAYVGAMVTWERVTDKVAVARRNKELAESISRSAEGVATSSEELSATSKQLATNAEETSTQANVVSAASEQVSKNIQTVAGAAEQMGASIKEIAKNATDAAKIAAAAVTVATTTNATISKLGESSADIGKVVKVITSIAQQTKLLALNATIEAARAGEAGKGFAVVANEVKELAKETARATEDIGQRIDAIQTDTRNAVDAIAEIGTIIARINEIQSTIAGAVEEQTSTTAEIARNVSEAARGAVEISRNVAGVATAAAGTTTGASDTQRAADALAELAAGLTKLIARLA